MGLQAGSHKGHGEATDIHVGDDEAHRGVGVPISRGRVPGAAPGQSWDWWGWSEAMPRSAATADRRVCGSKGDGDRSCREGGSWYCATGLGRWEGVGIAIGARTSTMVTAALFCAARRDSACSCSFCSRWRMRNSRASLTTSMWGPGRKLRASNGTTIIGPSGGGGEYKAQLAFSQSGCLSPRLL